ncbi:MAG TPA: histidine kinase, partial [Bdellovibrio sp.]|nr:histidine kinase [Bdellovibrio sp.]
MPGLLISLRIGFEVVVVNFLVSTAIYALIFQQSIPQMIRLKESFKFRFVVGFLGMALGLFVASILEPVLGNREMNFQGITVGLTIGSLTLLVFLLKSAYAQTQTYNLKLKAESAESTLNVLKNQIQPHFLFNSLNSLAELIDSDRESASQMTQKLSDLYREILESSKLQVSSLQSEISIVQKYLELESLRFGDRLKYQIETPEKMDDIFIPSLLLQTLIENAIKHGISQNLEGGIVSLKINADQNGFLVRIENTCAK